jgi:hypothetical protein
MVVFNANQLKAYVYRFSASRRCCLVSFVIVLRPAHLSRINGMCCSYSILFIIIDRYCVCLLVLAREYELRRAGLLINMAMSRDLPPQLLKYVQSPSFDQNINDQDCVNSEIWM